MVTVGIHCRTVGVLSETVGVLSEYCRKLRVLSRVAGLSDQGSGTSVITAALDIQFLQDN